VSNATVQLLNADILLVALAVAIYVAGAFVGARDLWNYLAAGGLLMAMALVGGGHIPPVHAGPVAVDPLASYVRWFALAAGLLFVGLTARPQASRVTPEFTGSLLLAVAGLMLTAAAADLVLLFVGLELVSIPTYVVLYLGRRDAANQEATAKYFFLSILASALLLYGFSFLYGTAGSTDLGVIRAKLAVPGATAAGLGSLARLAMILVFAGLGFKLTAVPMQFYAPDVYQGTSQPNAAILSVIPKAAGLVALVRIVVLAMPQLEPYAWRVALVLSVLTMTFGSVMGLWQDNLRRLMAYSSIAQAGYMLLGLAVALAGGEAAGGWDSIGAVLFYLSVYALATIGTFAVLVYLGRPGRQIDAVEELAGLGRTRPWAALAMAVFMFSLTGIPPVAGFWGKVVIFGSALTVHAAPGQSAALSPWFITAAVIGMLSSAIAAAYYLRIAAVMYFRTPLATPRAEGGAAAGLVAVTCAALVLAIGLYGRPLLERSMDAGRASWTVDSRTPAANPSAGGTASFQRSAAGSQ